MQKTTAIMGLLLSFFISITPADSQAQIYAVGNDDGFSLACAGTSGNELFLPVSLSLFEARCLPNGIAIKWIPSTVEPNSIYTPERSYDGKYFQSFPTTATKLAWGYECIDSLPGRKIQYFRIKQEKKGLLPEYSQTIAAMCNPKIPLVSPNPTTGVFTLQIEEPAYYLTLHNLSGKTVYERQLWETNQTIDAGFLGCGVYIMRIHSDFPVTPQRIVITQ